MLEYFWHYILTTLQMCVYVHFSNIFFRNGKAKSALAASLLVSLPIPIINAMEIMPLNLLSAYSAIFLVLLIVFREKPKRIAAMALVVYVLNFICELVTIFFASAIFGEYTSNISTRNISNVIYAFITLLIFFTITFGVKILVARNRGDNAFVFSANLRVVLLPIITIILGYYIMYTSDGRNKALSIVGLIIFILLIAVDITVLFGTENDLKKYEMETNLEAMQLQEEYNIEVIRQMEDSQKALAKQAHDFKNHLICIEGMMASQKSQNDMDAADEYVQNLVQDIDRANSGAGLDIKNTALRAIVLRLGNRCTNLGIELDTDIQYSDFSFMQFHDICSFFANAFDNAVWACQQIPADTSMSKTIIVCIKKRNSYVGIIIANSNTTPIIKSKRHFLSQKGKTTREGIGTQNMRRSIERYDGTLEMEQSDNLFTVTAVIPVPLPDEPNTQ